MGHFFSSGSGAVDKTRGMPSNELLHKLECSACPLNNARCTSPKMKPSGDKRPIIYMLGAAPDEYADDAGEPLAGPAGDLVREWVPDDWQDYIRFNNVIRTHPPGDRSPAKVEIECCRPSIVRDIEKRKPRAIFGFGEVPLRWAIDQSGALEWRGRRFPVKVGSHTCWYYAMLDPAWVLEQRRYAPKYPDELGLVGSESERMFVLDLKRAFAEVEKLPSPVVHTDELAFEGVECLTGEKPGDVKRIVRFLEHAVTYPVSGLDLETDGEPTGLRPYAKNAMILSAAVATPDGTIAFPIDHPGCRLKSADREAIRSAFEKYLYNREHVKTVHNVAFELEWLSFFFGRAVVRTGLWADTMSMAWVLDERRGDRKPGCLGLEFQVLNNFGFNLKDLSPLKRKALGKEPLRDVLRYNGMDAKYHLLLHGVLMRRLKEAKLVSQYKEQLRRVSSCVLTQLKGVPVSQKVVRHFIKEFSDKLAPIEEEIRGLKAYKKFRAEAGVDFEVGNNQHVLRMFRDVLGMKKEITVNKRGKEKESTDESTLSKIDHPLAKLVLQWREIAILKGTFCDRLDVRHEESYVWPDKLMHPIFNTMFTDTSRLSSEDPNGQNYPKRDHREVRRQVQARKGYLITSFDQGQIEFRVIGMASKDKNLVKAVWDGYDVHQEWAERVAHEYPARIGGKKFIKDKAAMKLLRSDVKNQFVFPSCFGATPQSISKFLKIPEEIAVDLQEEFWKTFPDVLNWQQRILATYREFGYTECLTGHKRRGPLTKNQVINSPIQGTAAWIVCDGMNRVSEREDWTLQPMLQIHDDLTFELPEDKVDDYAEVIISDMLRSAFTYDWINVPLQVEMAVGHNWCDLSEVGKYNSHEWFK